jgi:hypothetical protein
VRPPPGNVFHGQNPRLYEEWNNAMEQSRIEREQLFNQFSEYIFERQFHLYIALSAFRTVLAAEFAAAILAELFFIGHGKRYGFLFVISTESGAKKNLSKVCRI